MRPSHLSEMMRSTLELLRATAPQGNGGPGKTRYDILGTETVLHKPPVCRRGAAGDPP